MGATVLSFSPNSIASPPCHLTHVSPFSNGSVSSPLRVAVCFKAGGVQGKAGEGADQGSDHRKSAPCPWDEHGFRPNPMDLWNGQLSSAQEGRERYEIIPLR